MREKLLAVIPARSGSKRIPNKNIKIFCGKPLIAYPIKQALSCHIIDRVIVDTDSPRIAKIAKKYGAEVPWLRPARLAQDRSQYASSLLYLLKRLQKEQNYLPTHVIILQTTSPLRAMRDIMDTWRLMRTTNVTTALTVCSTHPRLYYLSPKRDLILVNDTGNKSTNTQSWRQGYILNGCSVGIVKTRAFLKEKSVITKKTKAVICPKWRSIDLDTPEEWVMAEVLYKNKERVKNRIKALERRHN